MVYDVSRNYIGDMHWRDDEILQDGDEFELDRGVLIQVGEATGSIEQDLTGLLEKRKKAPEVVVNEEVLHQPSAVPTNKATTAQPTQLRPKTLNAVLGTPKGRIGRAALPTKSPHELRAENENISWDHDRPAKRQRIESQWEKSAKLNTVPAPPTPAISRVPDRRVNQAVVGAIVNKQPEDKAVPATVRSFSPSSARNAGNVPAIPLIPRGKINKENKASERAIDPLHGERSSGPRGSASTEKQRKRKSDRNAQVSPKAKKFAKQLDHEPETGYATTSSNTKPIEIDGDERKTSTNKQPRQRLKLQMASRKPRKKLMYRDLLPQDSSGTGRSSGDALVRDRSTSSRPNNPREHPMAGFHKEEQDRLKARLNRHDAREIHRESEREEFCGEAPEDLFLSQEDVISAATNHHRMKKKEPIEKVSKSSRTGSRAHNTVPVSSSSRSPSSPEVLPEVIPRRPSTVHSSARTLARMDEIIISRRQSRVPESVEDSDVLPEVLPQESSPPPVSKSPPDVVSTPSPPKDRPGSSPAFQTQAHVPPTKTLLPEAPAETSILSRPNPDSLSTFTKVVQPKAQGPKRGSSNIPPPDPHIPKPPDETVEVLSSQPSIPAPATPVTAPYPPKRNAESLPAFVKVVPTKARSPLKKAVSDTSATRPPSALGISGGNEKELVEGESVGGKDETASLWSKEAWDLFGCDRDGVECTYEEFKRKEGLL